MPSASDYFRGGFITYSDQMKIRLLGVPAELIARAHRGERAGCQGDGRGRARRNGIGLRALDHRLCRAGRRAGWPGVHRAWRRRMAPKCGACSGRPIAIACGHFPPTSRSTCCGASFSALAHEAAMPFQILQTEAAQHPERDHGIHRASRIHAFADARAQLHVRLLAIATSHHANLRRPETGRLAALGAVHHVQSNAPELLRRQLREDQVIYCSPLVDPYQPAEETEQLMPRILDELLARPPEGVRDSDSRSADRARSAEAGRTVPADGAARELFDHNQSRGGAQAVRAALRDASIAGWKAIRALRARGNYNVRHARADSAVRSGGAGGDQRSRRRIRTSSAIRCTFDP